MIKKTIIALLAVLPMAAAGQGVETNADTAARIVDRYVGMLNYGALPSDSVLTMRTVVTVGDQGDTFVMLRWFVPPQMMRLEVWKGKRLHAALCTNGKDRYRQYKPDLGYWVTVEKVGFYERLVGYDFRGPLYNWRAHGASLKYKGLTTAMGGHRLETVEVEAPGQYKRYYFFEPTGLLSVIVETDEIDVDEYKKSDLTRIEWKCFHEYLQIGESLLPKQESFLRQGMLTVEETEAHFEPFDALLFNIDRR